MVIIGCLALAGLAAAAVYSGAARSGRGHAPGGVPGAAGAKAQRAEDGTVTLAAPGAAQPPRTVPAHPGRASAAPSPAAPPAAPADGPLIPVLEYHHLAPAALLARDRALNRNPYTVEAENFGRQLDMLQSLGFTTVSMAEVADFLEGKGGLPPKPVLITFDDGYESFYKYAYPALAARRMKATLFVIAGTVPESSVPFQSDKLTRASWRELAEMAASGLVDVESHTYNMHDDPSGRSQLVYASDAAVLNDLTMARQAIAQHLGRIPIALAYPHGAYNDRVVRLVQTAGYRLAFTGAGNRPIGRHSPRFALTRYVMRPGVTILYVMRRAGLVASGSGKAPAARLLPPAKPAAQPLRAR